VIGREQRAVAPGPAEAPLIDDGLAQNVFGLTGYAWIDSHLYLEAGGYITPAAGTLHALGVDPFDAGKIHGAAPYARVAYQRDLAGGTAQVGAFLLDASIFPGRDRTTGLSDHYRDIGVDASWYKSLASGDVVTANARNLPARIHSSEAVVVSNIMIIAADVFLTKVALYLGDKLF